MLLDERNRRERRTKGLNYMVSRKISNWLQTIALFNRVQAFGLF